MDIQEVKSNYEVIIPAIPPNTPKNERKNCEIIPKTSCLEVWTNPTVPKHEIVFCPVKYSAIGVILIWKITAPIKKTISLAPVISIPSVGNLYSANTILHKINPASEMLVMRYGFKRFISKQVSPYESSSKQALQCVELSLRQIVSKTPIRRYTVACRLGNGDLFKHEKISQTSVFDTLFIGLWSFIRQWG